MSNSSFDPVTITTNSRVRMLEVSDGVYLQGRELDEYCLKKGLCKQCGKVKVRRKKTKVFGSNTWEPITTVKVPLEGKRTSKRSSKNYMTVKAKIESGHDDQVEYLVYKGYCLAEGCYTLDQAKRLSGLPNKGMGSATSSVASSKSHSSNQSGSRTNSITTSSNHSNQKRKNSLFGGFRRRSKSSPNNPFFSPPQTDKHPLLTVGEDTAVKGTSVLSPMSNLTSTTVTGEVSSYQTTEPHDNNPRNQLNLTTTSYDSIAEEPEFSVVPSPQVRRNFQHEFSWGNRGSPKKRYHSRELYQLGSYDMDEEILPVREIVHETIGALQHMSNTILTLDLSGLKVRMSELEALSKIFKAGKNGTVHLKTLVLNNCGIDDGLMGILGQALYDALFTANNRINNSFNNNNNNTTNNSDNSIVTNDQSKLNKSMRHARMRLQSLNLGDNDIGDKGIQCLCLYLESISCELQDLDLSRNSIETSGGVAIFDALKRNPQTKIVSIDLSCNLLRELEDDQPKITQYSHKSIGIPGRSSGIHGFLSKNKTLKELDLSANRMTDEWVEALFRGLSLNSQSALEKVSLGFNRIGDRGAIAIGMCLTVNTSLLLLELNDNHIGNDGAQALVEAMEDNTTIKDIAGLWSNKIEKRHIIVSIRQLLVSETRERKKIERIHKLVNNRQSEDDSDDSDVDIYITSDSEKSSVPPIPLHSDSDSEHKAENEAESAKNNKLLDDEKGAGPLETSVENDDDKNISDFFDAHDTAVILSDLSDQEDEDGSDFERLLEEHGDENRLEAADGMMETNQEVTHNLFDRMTIMNASPLVCFKDNDNRTGIPLLDTRKETKAIKAALESQNLTRGSRIEVREEMATLDKFKAFFSSRDSSVLHLSCHGIDDGIALENGYGSLERLSLEDLYELVSSGGAAVRDTLVVVSSPLALKIGKAFLDAGMKRVVCCQRSDSFRDPLAVKFMEAFYQHASQKETLAKAFGAALRTVISSPLAKNSSLVSSRFHLLPLASPRPSSPIFFQRFVPNGKHHDRETEDDNDDTVFEPYQWNQILPPLPDYFLGREIDIFKILESLQITDCIEISGLEGCGKECTISASLEYALKRNETFSIDQVCWIPAPKRAMIDPDSLYGDLILCFDLIRDSFVDSWDRSEEVLDCRERLSIEMEDAKVVVVIDIRSFSSITSRSALQKLINFIVTSSSFAKVICISNAAEAPATNAEESVSSAIKRCGIQIDALPFRSTVRLFGEIYFNMARSATEFTELADIPFVSNKKDSSSEIGVSSNRRIEILERIGNGLPSEVVTSADNMSRDDFDNLMKAINTPEISIESASELESELRRRNTFMDLAVKDGNYKRSVDLEAKINELDGMRSKFCTMKDLKAKEKAKKAELADAVSNRRYDIANELKKDLLVLKRTIMKERRATTNRSVENQNGILSDLKFQVDSLADAIEHDNSFILDEDPILFDVDCDGHTCTFHIYCGNVFDPRLLLSSSERGIGVVCWSNEACSLEGSFEGKSLLGLEIEKFKECVTNLPVVAKTRHGSVRCLMGNSVFLDPRSSSVIDMVNDSNEKTVAILTVGPFSGPTGQIDALLERDDEFHRFALRTLRSCYRACVRQTQRANLRSLAICPLTTRAKNGLLYEETLKVAVREILEEAKFSPGLDEVRLVGKTPKEASLLVGIMKAMGFSLRVSP